MYEQRTERPARNSGGTTNALLSAIVVMLAAVIALEVYRIYDARRQPEVTSEVAWETRVVDSNLPPLQQPVSSALVPGHRRSLQSGGSAADMGTPSHDMHAQAKRLFDEARERFENIERQFYGPAGSPFELDPRMQELEQRVTHLFEQIREDPHFRMTPSPSFDNNWQSVSPSPGIDVRDMVSNYVITVSLADFNKPDINLNIHGNRLTITAVSQTMNESSDGNSSSSATSIQRFRRSIRLPEPIENPAAVGATFKGGILRIVVPHSPREKPLDRTIDVH